MALSQLASRLTASRVGCAYRNMAIRNMQAWMSTTPKRPTLVRAGPDMPDEDVLGEEDFDLLSNLSAPARRRVMALKEVQTEYDAKNREYQKELAQLQAKYLQIYAPLFDKRKEVVAGTASVGKYDIPDDNEPDTGISEFWLTAFSNHDKVGPFITERDAEVLKFLTDVRSEVLTREERGFKLQFYFKENPYFKNQVLEKSYVLEPEDDLVPKEFLGCKIDWLPGMDTTVEQVKKRVKAGKNDKGGAKAKAFVTETVPCDSFFNIFDPPKIPTDPNSLPDEAMDELQEELGTDFEIGFAIKENIIPRAVEWFTGEIVPYGDGMDEGEFDEYEDEEFDARAPPRR